MPSARGEKVVNAACSDTQFRFLTEADAEAVHVTHKRIFESITNKAFMYLHSEDFFRTIARKQGRLIGAFRNRDLIGYAALRLPGLAHNTHWRSLDRLSFKGEVVAEGAGCAVLPEFRNCGIFRELLRKRNEAASHFGAQYQTSIVAPTNFASLFPLLAEGFFIAAAHKDESGYNYLMVKPLLFEFLPPGGAGFIVSPHDAITNLFCLCEREMIGLPDPRGDAIQLKYYLIHQLDFSQASA